MVTTLLNIINIIIYFENVTIRLHVLHALNTNVKFCTNRRRRRETILLREKKKKNIYIYIYLCKKRKSKILKLS